MHLEHWTLKYQLGHLPHLHQVYFSHATFSRKFALKTLLNSASNVHPICYTASHFRASHASEFTDNELRDKVIILAGVIDPNSQEEIGLILYSGGKEALCNTKEL